MRQRSILTAMSIGALAFSVIGAAHAAPQPAKGAFADIVSATGGTVTNYIDAEGVSWIAHSFTTVGTNRFTVKSAGEVEYLVVGGGGGGGAGGGGSGGGGGGGGNAVIGKNLSLSAGSYNVVVGAGGAKAQDGGSSAFSDIVAGGGNRGASAEGGVGGACTSTVYGTTTGYTGGIGHSANPQRAGGGGAGSGANGLAAAPRVGGNGGAGVASSITGVTTNYGGGGGGGAECTSNPPGQGGAGGGGSGEANVPYVPGGYSGSTPYAGYQPATPGVNGLGGGGGGAGGFSGVVAGLGNTPGGSGIVVVRYMTDPNAPIIQNQPVANVTTTSAAFNGLLVRTGTTACAVCVLWGEQDGGNTWNWAHTNWFFGGKATPALGNGQAMKTNITSGIGKNKVYWYTYAAVNATSKEVASPSKLFSSGPVQVEATVDTAQYTTRNGVFTISRPPGCTNTAVTVAYTLSGTAANGTHYTGLDNLALPLYATIEAGAASKVVTLKPRPFSPARTALLTLTSASDNGYPVSAARYTGAVTLQAFAGKVWNGAADTAWNNPTNWADGVVPTETDDVVIDGGANQPTLDLARGPVTIKSLAVGANNASTLTFKNSLVADVNRRLRVTGDVIIAANGKLTHAPETATGAGAETQQLHLDVGGDLTVNGSSPNGICVTACGYNKGQGPCPGNDKNAASHGGQGGGNDYFESGLICMEPYGSVTDPARSGSGGTDARGGGVAKLTIAGNLNMNGSICADAGGFDNHGAAGGSVNITAGTLTHSGSATISANGGSGQRYGGGGGRVAIVLTNAADTAFAGMTITAYGGTMPSMVKKEGGGAGSAGTVYLKGNKAAYGNLIVDNKPNPATTRRVLINANTGDLTVNNLVLQNNGRIGFDAVTRKVTVYGSWFNGSEANAISWSDLTPGGAATVIFAGDAPATVTGTNIWYNLAITNANKVVTFPDGATQTVDSAGTVTLGSGVKLRTASGAPFAFARGPRRGVDGILRDKPDYTVRVQGKEVEVFSLPVNLIKARDGRDLPANFATCDMAGTVTVEVTVNFLDAAKIGGVSVHPLSRGIKAQREGARITFQVDRPGSLTLLVNGDHGLQPLHLFLCPPVEPPPPGAMVFGPGRHVVGGEDKPIRLKSGQTLYLAPGAWVVGNVRVDNATNICIMGRGVLTPMSRPFTPGQWASGPTAIFLNECQDVRIEGIVVTRPSLDWNITLMHCDTVTLRDVHVISPVAWSTDGCNPYNTRNVTIERCFFRDNDDCISPKGDFTMNPKNLQLALENITIRDSVFWCGQGGLFSIGPESVTKHIRNIKMQNCDVLYHSGGNTFQIVPVYGVEVRDVLYEDIRLETAVSSALFFFGPGGMCGDKSAEPPSIRGVTIRNVTFLDANAKRNSVMEGWGPDHLIQDVTIENLRYGDELILDAKAMGLKTNAWVKNLRFIGPAGKK